MKAVVLEENGKLVYRDDLPMPVPAESEVLVRMLAVGMCSSDLPRAFAAGSYRYPHILGHEIFGELADGSRVAVYPLIPCRACEQCRVGAINCCTAYSYLGSRRDGGCAEYVSAPIVNCIAAPRLDSVLLALTEPMAVVIHAARSVSIPFHATVRIIGDGPMATMLGYYLLRQGHRNIVITGKHPEKLALPALLGIRTVSGPTDHLPPADVIFELAGSNSAYEAAIAGVRPHGTIIMIGNIRADLAIPAKVFSQILRKEIRIIGSWNSLYADWQIAIPFLASAPEIKQVVSHAAPLSDAPQLLSDAYRGTLPNYSKIVFTI